MIQSIDAEALIKQAAEYFRLGEAEFTRKRGRHRQERALVMELLHRYSGLKQRMIAERFGGLDEELVSRDRRAVREKIDTEPKIRKWFQDVTRLSQDLTVALLSKFLVSQQHPIPLRNGPVLSSKTCRVY